jgi:hypothetical protein
MPKDEIRALEEQSHAPKPASYPTIRAPLDTDVPVMIPEINPEHVAVIRFSVAGWEPNEDL